MRILTIHADYLKFEPKKKALKTAEDVEKKVQEIKECLVIFTAVEKKDEANKDGAVESYLSQIRDVAEQVKTKNLVLYPYAHLSSDLAMPEMAVSVMKEAEAKLKEEGFKVIRAPFGWYKSFEISCKGHPLSELSREFGPEEQKKAPKERKKGSEFSKFLIIGKDGKKYAVTKENWQDCLVWKEKGELYERLKVFVSNELEGHQSEAKKPKHIEYMRRLELVDYCPESDVGHFKWFSNGLLIKDLILAFQEKLAKGFGAFKIANPLLYRLSVPDINKLLGEFHEKDYSWREGSETLILRFASDPGAFPFMQKVMFSHKIMPIKEYEEAICFRKEQRGELVGLRRVRNFTMTDVHAFCKDESQSKEEFEKLCFICQDLMNSIISKGRWVLGWEAVEEFYEKNEEWLIKLIKAMGVPSFFKLMKERGHYYSLKNEFQSIEADGANSQISTVQFDVVNGERFNINYVAEDGKKYPCIILHCSTFGSIERTLCSILENAANDEKEGLLPMLPLWLSPTQIRIIPVSVDNHLNFSLQLAKKLEEENIRVDIDDRQETVGKRIMNAEEKWVPYILVVGEKEMNSQKLTVRIRAINKQKEMAKEELTMEIKEKTKDMPFKSLALHQLLSKRPIFIG
ncbi:threonine--tRNA ligase [Candidatus Woesearchaeota archaeon]|nr:threonine--tRNA ligase [Candidatus Woesearchaeota archaeon]